MTFLEDWHKVREKTQSTIVAGLDPALPGMRDKNALADGVSVREWCLQYVEAVAPHVAAIKCNPAYYQYPDGLALMEEIVGLGKAHGLLMIADYKISDIGSTNDSWLYFTKKMRFDAVTGAPYAGNVEELITQAHERDLGIFTMALMSNPEYQSEMVAIDGSAPLYETRTVRSIEAGVDGIVIGATYEPSNPHLQKVVTLTKNTTTLFLVPGIGAQGGSIEQFLASGIDKARCLMNVGRGLMFPNGQRSTPEEQRAAAQHYQAQVTITS
ncbi:MAG: Orotidine 5-phosphate decarboxylase [Candidatus Parcubacteria bacterium]|jgi:orotidine-5'-phosphate decarboxylase